MNFCERFLNVHVGKSKGGNYAIETLIVEWQAFTGAFQISSVWKSHLIIAMTRRLSSMSSPVTSSEAGTPQEARSRPDPQPNSRTRISLASVSARISVLGTGRRHCTPGFHASRPRGSPRGSPCKSCQAVSPRASTALKGKTRTAKVLWELNCPPARLWL